MDYPYTLVHQVWFMSRKWTRIQPSQRLYRVDNMVLYLINGFSVKMLKAKNYQINFKKISKNEFIKLKDKAISYIGHPTLARRLDVSYNRDSIKLDPGDECLCVYGDPRRPNTQNYQKTTAYDNNKLNFALIEIN